jgi:hypothetical protein
MCQNTIKSGKREAKAASEFWRAVIEQAWIKQALKYYDE